MHDYGTRQRERMINFYVSSIEAGNMSQGEAVERAKRHGITAQTLLDRISARQNHGAGYGAFIKNCLKDAESKRAIDAEKAREAREAQENELISRIGHL